MSRYTFRDTDPAEVRLALLAKVFEPEMRVLLARLPERPVRFALDLDSLPGFSWMSSNRNALWEWIYPGVYVRSARAGFPDLEFVEHDVTQTPFPIESPDFIIARFFLTHLSDPEGILGAWANEMAPRGLVAVAEVEFINTEHPVFSTYLSVVESLIADSGGKLYLGPRLAAADPKELRRLSSEVYRAPVSTGDAAKMFSLNLSVWRSDRFVVDNYETSFLDVLARRLEQLQAQTCRDRIEWGIRHIVYERLD